MRNVSAVVVILGLLISAPVLANGGFSSTYILSGAQLGQVRFSPEYPAITEPLAVSVDVDGCTTASANPDARLSEVRIGGDQRISVLISALEFNPICNLISPPPPPQRFTQQLPGLESGTWTVDLFLSDPSEPFPQDVPGEEPFASGTVIVTGNLAARPIPLLSRASLLILVLSLGLLAVWRLRSA
jgi:hypothetical protein